MSTFVRNNIRFRASASKALEGFYNSKAFILNEVIEPSNMFSETARELILLKFVHFADFLNLTERTLLNEEYVSEEKINEIEKSFIVSTKEIRKVAKEHPEVFNETFLNHWSKVHDDLYGYMRCCIRKTQGMSQLVAFPLLTEYLVEYLNLTMFELYELDCLLGSNLAEKRVTDNTSFRDEVILFIDDVTLDLTKITSIPPERERLSYYINHVIDKSKTVNVQVRDYSSVTSIPGLKNKVHDKVKEGISSISNLGNITFSCRREHPHK